MTAIELAAIVIPPNRQRRSFDEGELQRLVESIERNGLLHAIILRQVNGDFHLVAGERRLRAIRDIADLGGRFTYAGEPVPKGFIPYTNLGDLSALEAMEAEFEENVRRTDLTWQEKAKATAALAGLRRAQAEQAGLPPPTVAQISAEIKDSPDGSAREDTKKEIILAKYLDDPDIAKAPTLRDGFKILQRKEAAERSAGLSALVGRSFSAKDHTLVQADCVEWLDGYPDAVFDVILSDPPYGMGADEFGDSGGKTAGAHGYEDSEEGFRTLLRVATPLLSRVTKPQAHLYLFCDIDQFVWLRSELAMCGWKVHRTPLIWHKPAAFRAPWPEHGPQRKYELILYAIKGERKTLKLAPDVITCPTDENLGHAAQKPVGLFADLLSRSAHPGDTVLDFCCGTGPIFPAAHALKVKATGIELDAAAHGIAAKRIQGLK